MRLNSISKHTHYSLIDLLKASANEDPNLISTHRWHLFEQRLPEIQRQIYQRDHHRDLDQRSDHRCECDLRSRSEYRHRDRDRQLEVIRRCGETQCAGLAVIRVGSFGEEKTHHEHDHEVDQKRDRDTDDVHRYPDNRLAFQGEHHDDREEQCDERDGTDSRDEFPLVPVAPLDPHQVKTAGNSGDERDAEVDEYCLCDLAECDFFQVHLRDSVGKAEERGQEFDEKPREDREEQNLEDRVECHQTGCVFAVAVRKIVPDNDHRDTSRQADHDQSDHVLGVILQKDYRQKEHEEGSDNPVLNQTEDQDSVVSEYVAQFLVTDFCQRGVHHEDQSDCDWDVGGPDAEAVPESSHSRPEIAPEYADSHREEDPEREEAVEKGKSLGGGIRFFSGDGHLQFSSFVYYAIFFLFSFLRNQLLSLITFFKIKP
jgi:hypothetical protein